MVKQKTKIILLFSVAAAGCLAFSVFHFSKKAAQPDVDPAMLALTDSIMIESDFDPSDYTISTLNSKFPYEVIEYYRTMNRGNGSTRPVIYSDQKNHTYYIVYQQGDGVNVIDELILSGEQDNSSMTSSRYTS